MKTIDHGGQRLNKASLLLQWSLLEPNQDPLAVMQPISKGGSSYGGDGIRICGSDAFVSAVLSRLQDMIDGENQLMRLSASHSIVAPTEIGGVTKSYKYSGGNCVYIQIAERGPEAVGFGSDEATERYIERVPGLREALKRGAIAWYELIGFSHEEAVARATKRTR